MQMVFFSGNCQLTSFVLSLARPEDKLSCMFTSRLIWASKRKLINRTSIKTEKPG